MALIFFNIIISCIFKRLKKYAIIFPEDESLSEMVNKKLLEPFAHLETKRKNYHKEDINIVIDATDWGHIVGEIEVSFCILLSGILKIENVKKRNLGLLE